MAKRDLELLVEETEDDVVQENFDRVRLFLKEDLFTKFDGEFFSITFLSAVTNFKFAHSLGFIPKDVIVTSQIGSGTATFNYGNFDRDNIDITTTGAVDLRFVAGQFVTDR